MMDIFKQKRYLLIVIVVLVIMNIGTLFLLWIGKPSHPTRPGTIVQGQEKIEQLLKEELGFDESQVDQYLKLREKHHQNMTRLNNEIRKIKKQMFDEVLKDDPKPVISESLLKLSQDKQAKIEQLTFQHFVNLKNICKPDQQKKLKVLMHQLFRKGSGGVQDGPPPPPQGRGDSPPPPPRNDDRRPPPPSRN